MKLAMSRGNLRQPHCKNRRRGQATILFGLMVSTLLIFFMFVVNTGLLVNAKINLQNAADLAAYAGASVQARQLDYISYLNYEMRRAYKKFIFKYYVVGNMAQRTHPDSPASGKRDWNPAPGTNPPYNVPVVCLKTNQGDNYCFTDRLQAITAAQSGFADVLNDSAQQIIKGLELIRQNSCNSVGKRNIQLLMLWLFNPDPQVTGITNQIATLDPEQAQLMKILEIAGQGLGLIPKEILLRMRIKTLTEYVNEDAKTGLNFSKLQQLMVGKDMAKRERTIQAYLSAYYTLGEHTFYDPDEIVMDELLPPGNKSLLDLKDIAVSFDTYAINLGYVPPNGTPDATTCQKDFNPNNPVDANGKPTSFAFNDCVACPTPITINAPVPVGVKKNPDVLTYYAIRLKAKAKIMFSKELELTAYAAAKPFGSRIGPQLRDVDFLRKVSNPTFCSAITSGGNAAKCVGYIPALPVKDSDPSPNPDGGGTGWDNNDVIYPMFKALTGANAVNPNDKVAISGPGFARGLFAAMVPNPWESGRYNILANDVQGGGSSNVRSLTDQWVENFNANGEFAFWAPIVSPEAIGTKDLSDSVREFLNSGTFQPQPGTMQRVLDPAILDVIAKGILDYSDKLKKGAGEDGDGFNVTRIRDPFHYPADTGVREPIEVGVATLPFVPKQIKTSWSGIKHKDWQDQGRTGYSVKFVSFRQLASEGNTGATLKSALGDDLNFIQH